MKIRANSVVTPYKSSPHPLVRGRAIIQSAHKQLFFTLRSNDRLGPTLYTTAIDDTSQYEVFFMGSGQAEISFKYMICFQNHSETSLLHPENWRCFVYEEIFKQSPLSPTLALCHYDTLNFLHITNHTSFPACFQENRDRFKQLYPPPPAPATQIITQNQPHWPNNSDQFRQAKSLVPCKEALRVGIIRNQFCPQTESTRRIALDDGTVQLFSNNATEKQYDNINAKLLGSPFLVRPDTAKGAVRLRHPIATHPLETISPTLVHSPLIEAGSDEVLNLFPNEPKRFYSFVTSSAAQHGAHYPLTEMLNQKQHLPPYQRPATHSDKNFTFSVKLVSANSNTDSSYQRYYKNGCKPHPIIGTD